MTTTYLPDVAVTAIVAHGANPRRDVGDVDDLAASIKAHGLLEPLVVAPINGVEYRLIAGHRRLAAAKQAGHSTVPVLLREDLDTPPKQLEAMLIENTQRVDLTPVEEADAYAQLVAFPGYTATKAAKATGRSVKVVKQRLAIAALDDKVKRRVHSGQVSLADAATLSEFAGTPEYDTVEKAAGTGNFAWTVQRARELAHIRTVRELVEKVCAEHGWGAPEHRYGHEPVLESWGVGRMTIDVVQSLLDGLEGEHFFVVDTHSWRLLAPAVPDAEDDDVEPAPRVETPEQVAEREAREARQRRQSDIETARLARLDWMRTTAWQQRIGKDERVHVLRHLLAWWVGDANYNDDDLAMAYMPHGDDVDEDQVLAWTETADEPQLWRALCVMALDLARCGYFGDRDHAASIRFAQLFGYEPSDVERELLEPAAVPA